MDCCQQKAPLSNNKAAWICPMCPSVGSDSSGSCPHCGMALEARVPAVGEENPELGYMLRRLWFALACMLPLLAITLGGLLPGTPGEWVQALLASLVVLYSGWPFFQRGYESVLRRRLNMFTLIAMGVGVAYGHSLFLLILASEPGGLHFQAAAMIICLVLLGQVLELSARQRTGRAITALLNLSPKRAQRLDGDGLEEEILIAEVVAGDRLRIRPGERIPVDGRVLEGLSEVDEAMISGEPMPVSKAEGAALIGGTLNGRGSLLMRADHGADEGLLARMVAQVARAQRSRAPVQGLVDRVAAFFVPLVLLIALASFCYWYFLRDAADLSTAIMRAIAVLVVACPCALGLATPMSIMVTMGRAAQKGLLFRNAEAIEALQTVDTLLLDKTGTLTVGHPELTRILPLADLDADAMLELAASLERSSEHPLGTALVQAAEARGLALESATNFVAVPGKGVLAELGGKRVLLGNESLLRDKGLEHDQLAGDLNKLRQAGSSAMIMAIDDRVIGLFAFADQIKAGSKHLLEDLAEDGLRLIMLTGDSQKTAAAVAESLGISEVHAAVLPEDKRGVVAELQEQGLQVAMAGDGINDAAALAQADVGIAMGTGSDVAIESASLTLVGGELRGIKDARRLSRVSLGNIRQNLCLAFAYNILAIPLAGGFLEDWITYTPSPTVAAAAMAASSLVVVLNALRIR